MDVLAYRVKAYVAGDHRPGGGTTIITSITTLAEANYLLAAMIDSNIVTGGHIETDIHGIGWVVCSPDLSTESPTTPSNED